MSVTKSMNNVDGKTKEMCVNDAVDKVAKGPGGALWIMRKNGQLLLETSIKKKNDGSADYIESVLALDCARTIDEKKTISVHQVTNEGLKWQIHKLLREECRRHGLPVLDTRGKSLEDISKYFGGDLEFVIVKEVDIPRR